MPVRAAGLQQAQPRGRLVIPAGVVDADPIRVYLWILLETNLSPLKRECRTTALVTTFEPITKDRPKVHKPTRCTYFTFIGPRDKRYFVLEAYGSEDREFPDKVSQSVQLDEDAAARLIAILRQEFPNLG